MKRTLYLLSALFTALLFTPARLSAQWSQPEVILPWEAVPAQFGDEDVSPFIAAASDPAGTIHLVWSNDNQGMSTMVHASRQNGAWSEITTISSENPYSVMPSLIIDENGTLHCAWVTMDFNFNFLISYSRKFSGENWESPVVVSDPELLLNTYPQLVVDNAGNIRLFYTAADFSGENAFYYLKHALIDQQNTDNPVLQPVPQTSPDLLANQSSVVADANGMLHCVWHDSEGGASNISTASFDGTAWGPTTKLANSGQGSSIQDEMPIVLLSNSSNETFALWVASMSGIGQFSIMQNSSWSPGQNTADPHFRNATGLCDPNNVLNMAGTTLSPSGGDLYHHTYQNGTWEHNLIEAGTSTSAPGFPVLVIGNDTLFCFYVRNTQSSGYLLVESHQPIDFHTGTDQQDPLFASQLNIFPNPVNASGTLGFNAPGSGTAELSLYDLAGKKVAYNRLPISTPGMQTFTWNQVFANLNARKGLYILEVKNDEFRVSGKVVIE